MIDEPHEELFIQAFQIIFYPFLAINIITLVICQLKGYWIEKYNNNKDITYKED